MIDAARLAEHYRRFHVSERLLLTGHSHQAWPDVAREALLEAFDDAAAHVDDKWEAAFAKAERLRSHLRRWLDDPEGEIAFGANTHELLMRVLSALDMNRRPHIVTTDTEFHSAARQLGRLNETGVDVTVVPAQPVDTLAERLAAACGEKTAAVYVSSVLFQTSQIVPHLGELVRTVFARGVETIIDVYHHVGPALMSVRDQGIGNAWIVGGGYKYLQWGEGACYLRLPPHSDRLRPVNTGWYAMFGLLESEGRSGETAYADGHARWAGSTYDPTSHYRAAAVADFFTRQGLTPPLLAENYRRQVGILADTFDDLDLPRAVVERDHEVALDGVAGFLALRSPHAVQLQQELRAMGILTDARGDFLRFGPAPYLSDQQLVEAVSALAPASSAMSR
ncbi:kynureninase [Haloglycomyces albus]|uniref:kynureninase n=1 Tax=Haloglycomyces albus TaxID=526067 RepID=UPI00046C96C3|nr:kynureninase [Haloglycomyces albus]